MSNFISNVHYFYWLIISGIFFAIGEFLSKKFALKPTTMMVVWVIAAYAVGSLAWLPAILKQNQLSIVGTLWSVISLVITVLIGLLLFKEKLTLLGTLGIIAALISIILLSIGQNVSA